MKGGGGDTIILIVLFCCCILIIVGIGAGVLVGFGCENSETKSDCFCDLYDYNSDNFYCDENHSCQVNGSKSTCEVIIQNVGGGGNGSDVRTNAEINATDPCRTQNVTCMTGHGLLIHTGDNCICGCYEGWKGDGCIEREIEWGSELGAIYHYEEDEKINWMCDVGYYGDKDHLEPITTPSNNYNPICSKCPVALHDPVAPEAEADPVAGSAGSEGAAPATATEFSEAQPLSTDAVAKKIKDCKCKSNNIGDQNTYFINEEYQKCENCNDEIKNNKRYKLYILQNKFLKKT